MANLFSGLEKLGFGNLNDVQLFEEPAEKKADGSAQKQEEVHKVSESDMLFDKSYTCPVCNNEFKTKAVRAGRTKLDHMDSDLRPVYTPGDTTKYSAIVCPKCGYAALDKYYNTISVRQERAVKDNITPKFQGLKETGDFYTYDDAIERFQLVLLTTIVKGARNSEKDYVCLKLAWLVRGKREELDPKAPDFEAKRKELAIEEYQYLENAYEGFSKAMSSENFPIAGMDENTLSLVLGATAANLGKKDEASRWLTSVITSRIAKENIKDRARNIRDEILGKTPQA